MNKYLPAIFSVIGIFFCLTNEIAYSKELSGLIVESSDNIFQVFLKENPKYPIIQIKRMPKVISLSVSPINDRKNILEFPFSLYLDADLDGIYDAKVSGKSNMEKIVKKGSPSIGCQITKKSRRLSNSDVLDFSRIEFELHNALEEESIFRKREFKINRIIFRRVEDGNVQISFRDKFYNSGRDVRFLTNFNWEKQ